MVEPLSFLWKNRILSVLGSLHFCLLIFFFFTEKRGIDINDETAQTMAENLTVENIAGLHWSLEMRQLLCLPCFLALLLSWGALRSREPDFCLGHGTGMTDNILAPPP